MRALFRRASGHISPEDRIRGRIGFRRQLVRGLGLGLTAGLTFSAVAAPYVAAAPSEFMKAQPLSLHIVLVSVWVLALVVATGVGRWTRRAARHATAHHTPASVVAEGRRRNNPYQWKTSVLGVVTAVGLLGPLSLHALVCLPAMPATNTDFWGWGLWSVILTAHVHLVGVYRLRRDARTLMADPDVSMGRAFGRTVLFTTLASLFPGAILFIIPPLLVLATGLVVYGASYFWLARRGRGEARLMRSV